MWFNWETYLFSSPSFCYSVNWHHVTVIHKLSTAPNKLPQTRCENTIHHVEIPFQKWYGIFLRVNFVPLKYRSIWEVTQYFKVSHSVPFHSKLYYSVKEEMAHDIFGFNQTIFKEMFVSINIWRCFIKFSSYLAFLKMSNASVVLFTWYRSVINFYTNLLLSSKGYITELVAYLAENLVLSQILTAVH